MMSMAFARLLSWRTRWQYRRMQRAMWIGRNLPGIIRYGAFIAEVATVTTRAPLMNRTVGEIPLGDLLIAVGKRYERQPRSAREVA